MNPHSPDPESFLATARDLAYEAGRRVMELLRLPLVAVRKPDHSLLTSADHASNEIILSGLRKSFPAHAVLSEETGWDGSPHADFVWVIDPLDGTRAYAKGIAGFSVMVGLLQAGKPFLGVVYDPVDQRLFEAVRGGGAFQWSCGRRGPVRVSHRTDWMAMPVITSTGFSSAMKRSVNGKIPVHFLSPLNSVGVKVGYLVRQAADLYLNHHPVHLWDTLAPLVVLEEAGGRMTHWDGTPLTYPLDGSWIHPQPTLASNGTRHEELVTLLKGLP